VHLSWQQWRPFIGGRGEGGRRPEVGIRRCAQVKAGRGGFGGLLACAAVHCGVVTRVLAYWNGQRQRQRDVGGSGLFLLFSSMSHGRGLGREKGESTAG
jgi:hypothetical protein